MTTSSAIVAPSANRDAFVSEQALMLAGHDSDAGFYGSLTARLISASPIQRQFETFVDRMVASIGVAYLPVYRMADGEFAFMTGVRPLAPAGRGTTLRGRAGALLGAMLPHRRATCWGERYSRTERASGLDRLAAGLRVVGRQGVIAAYFMRRPDAWCEHYFETVCQFLDKAGVMLTAGNYVPFYFVYALLTGPQRSRLFRGRRILVVTHLTERRIEAISRGLLGEGASHVEFVAVSAAKSMLDPILLPLHHGCDVALVAAGIGSINVLRQLEGFPGPCIDAGAALEAYISPAIRHERPFLRLVA